MTVQVDEDSQVAETLVPELKEQTERLASAAMIVLLLIGTYY
jgi:hypothetical protein